MCSDRNPRKAKESPDTDYEIKLAILICKVAMACLHCRPGPVIAEIYKPAYTIQTHCPYYVTCMLGGLMTHIPVISSAALES